jgi:hypothetical protein
MRFYTLSFLYPCVRTCARACVYVRACLGCIQSVSQLIMAATAAASSRQSTSLYVQEREVRYGVLRYVTMDYGTLHFLLYVTTFKMLRF